MSVKSLLVNRCTINRNTPTKNDDDVWVNSFGANQTDVPFKLEEGRGSYKQGEAGEALEYDAIGLFAGDADVKPRAGDTSQDQFVVTTPATNAKFLVVAVVDETGHAQYLVAYLKHLKSKTQATT